MGRGMEDRLPPAQRTLLVCAAAFCIASSGLLVKASQVSGETPYSKFSVTLLAESLKLSMAGTLWLREIRNQREGGAPDSPSLEARDGIAFTVPAVLYVVVNNIRYPILERINPAVYSVVWNLKVVGVAGLLACALGRSITRRQWCGVLLLMIGSSLAEASQWDLSAEPDDAADLHQQLSDRQHGAETASEPTQIGRQTEGLILLGIGLAVVSVANVLTEHLYKRTGDVPLHKQNALLYTCGVCFNAVGFVLFRNTGSAGFFHGFTGWTLLVIVSQGVSGYLVGALFKYVYWLTRVLVLSLLILSADIECSSCQDRQIAI